MLANVANVYIVNKCDSMTIELKEGDRIYKIIEVKTLGNERKRFISKIDENKKITILTYIFNTDDIKKDGTLDNENKRMMLLIKEISEEQFGSVMNINYKIYPEFEILWEKDYSNKSLEDAIEIMNLEGYIATDIPIKKIINKIKHKE